MDENITRMGYVAHWERRQHDKAAEERRNRAASKMAERTMKDRKARIEAARLMDLERGIEG